MSNDASTQGPAEQPEESTSEEMLGSPVPDPGAGSAGTERDPSEWVTGDDPATEAQKTYLDRLAREAGEQIPADLTKAAASEHIDRLQEQTNTPPRSD